MRAAATTRIARLNTRGYAHSRTNKVAAQGAGRQGRLEVVSGSSCSKGMTGTIQDDGMLRRIVPGKCCEMQMVCLHGAER
jgi:hypothetical protein